jgi:hypothetical protein
VSMPVGRPEPRTCRERGQRFAFASYALPCQKLIFQTVPLLSSVAQQQSLTEYWWEGVASTAMSPISASDVVGQHN